MSRDAETLGAARNRVSAAIAAHDLAAAQAALTQLRALYVGAEGPPQAMAAALAELGDFASVVDDYPGALAAYDQAIALQPAESRYWFNRAAIRRFLGELAAAERDYDQTLLLDPSDGQAWLNRSDLRTQTREANHLPQLEAALAAGSADWRFRVPLHYALVKEYEDVGDYGNSWRHLHAGAQLRRTNLRYDVRADLETVGWLIKAFPSAPAPSVAKGPAGPRPIFIVGLPRTGSTLVDRIVGNHDGIHSTGELSEFGAAVIAQARAALRASARPPQTPTRQELVMASARVDFATLGADYLRRVRPRLPHATSLQGFTDKLPLNYLYCGLIARALPHARIVHVTRHPMAVCHAIYKVLFDQGYPFSYDLGEIADYYVGYRRLMAHWHATLPGRIHDISYEALVSEPETQARALLDAVGLSWQDACLQFHESTTPVATASASQVRRPIYSSSIALWRHYEAQLAPVQERLLAAGITLDP